MKALIASLLVAVAISTTGAVSAKAHDQARTLFEEISRNGP